MPDAVTLAVGSATATIALVGAEPVRWQVDGRELLWSGDPAHWGYRAPILFPCVGASSGGLVQVDGVSYPMGQHGFARTARFALLDHDTASARLRLVDTDETRVHYPFSFQLDVVATLATSGLSLAFEVVNTDRRSLPYGLGFHPAFPWPLDGTGRDGHRIVFAQAERASVPEVAAGGLLARRTRPIPLAGRELPLSPDMFSEALVFLDARSRAMSFKSPSGMAIRMETDNFPHLAVWSRPTAPFLSLECWTGHADWEDAQGELAQRASTILLRPGETGHHRVSLAFVQAPDATIRR